MSVNIDIDTDTFFLTAPFATADLKARIEELMDQLHRLQGECAEVQLAHDQACADLAKMQAKAAFVQSELVKNMALFTPPPEDDTEKRYETLVKDVFSPLDDASVYLGGAGAAMWAVGAGGPKLFRLASRLPRLSTFEVTGGSSRWVKQVRGGRAASAVSTALFLVEAGLKLPNASEINAHFKARAAEIRQQVDDGTSTIEELRQVAGEVVALRTQLLEQSAFSSTADYLHGLNEAIATLGRQRASLLAVRRMLLEGLPLDMVSRFMPDLAGDAIKAVARKLRVERALLRGDSKQRVAAACDATLAQVKQIARVQQARMQLLEGRDPVDVQEDTRLPMALVEAEAEVLGADLRHAWSMLENHVAPEQIAGKCLFGMERIETFAHEHDAKEMFFAGNGLQQVAAGIPGANGQLQQWQSGLKTALEKAGFLLQEGSAGDRLTDIAADLRIPLSVLRQVAA